MRRWQPIRSGRRKITKRRLMEIYQALYRHFGPRHWWPGETAFEVMVGAILTQNTAWTNVAKAIKNLKKRNLLTVSRLKEVPQGRLARSIRPAGYFNVKAKRLKSLVAFLWEKYDGDPNKMKNMPLARLRAELLGVNGVGPETADSIILYAVGKPSFVVDAYTRRVFMRHRFIAGSEDYDVIRTIFSERLSKSVPLYNEYHAQIVEVGKEFCRKKPKCAGCPLEPYL